VKNLSSLFKRGDRGMYQASYRKLRPGVFSDVVGQEHIVTTLKNEIKNNKIAHAYLFTGTRGTGKTTCARILAKAVNCENPVGGDPCGVCGMCKEIDDGSLVDIIEIDGASHNRVEHAQDILSEVIYTPVKAKRKVYIIDEVHMLTTSAFNALLKTLEEPPEHVMFILATTEPNKVLQTISSRCQRFDFKRIPHMLIFSYLEKIAKAENIDYEREALIEIAKHADGAMRDALSLMDLCLSMSGELKLDSVLDAVGTVKRDKIYELGAAIGKRDAPRALTIFGEIYDGGKSVMLLAQELITYYRNLLILKSGEKALWLLENTGDTYDDLKGALELYTSSDILYEIELLGELYSRFGKSFLDRVEFECCLFKMCDPALSGGLSSVESRLSRLELFVKDGAGLGVTNEKNTASIEKKSAKNDGEKAEKEPEIEIPDPIKSPDDAPDDTSEDILKFIDDNKVQAEKETGDIQDDDEIFEEVLSRLAKKSMPLKAMLDGAQASKESATFTIFSENPLLSSMVDTLKGKEVVGECLKEMGFELAVLFKEKPASAQDVGDFDPIDELM